MTDPLTPISISISILISQGVSEKLGTLIEGESLFNDGSAIVVFEVFLGESAVLYVCIYIYIRYNEKLLA